MAQIIKFQKKTDKERVKALVKGRIKVFTCDTCGTDIEVINEVYPKKCPGCGYEITQWNKSEENR